MTIPSTAMTRWRSKGHPGGDSKATRIGAGILALLPMMAVFALTIGTNTPIGPRLPLAPLRAPIEMAAYFGPASGALLLGFTAKTGSMRVGMLSAGVFSGLVLFTPSASIPAAMALATAAVLVGVSVVPKSIRSAPIQTVVTIALSVGVILSMIGILGFEPALIRRLGSVLIAVGLAGLPAMSGYSRRSIGIGLVGGALVVAAGLSAPVMTAAVSLLGMGVIGLPLALLGIGAAGGITAIAEATRRGRTRTAIGSGLVLVAGVPSSIPAAVAVIVALGLIREVPSK